MRAKRQHDAIEAAQEADEIEAIRRATMDGAPTAVPQPSGEVRLKIRGQDVKVDPEQILALAQKTAAGDDYLREARETLVLNAVVQPFARRGDPLASGYDRSPSSSR